MSRVLVVDDIPANRALIVTLVTHLGHTALEAADGAEALELVARERPALVICDILMPTMDGHEFVLRLRADPLLADTNVIFYSAYYREREARSLAQACGVTHVLSKPCEPAEILRIIGQALAPGEDAGAPAADLALDQRHLRVMADEVRAKAEELQASNHRFAALIDLNLQLASEQDPRTLLDHVCRGARDLLGAKYAVLAVREKNHDSHTYSIISGVSAELADRLPQAALQNGRLGQVYTGREVLRAANPDGAAEYFGLPPEYPPAHAGLAAPVVSLNLAYGWIFLADKVGGGQFDAEDERLLAILGAQVGRIYENGSLYYQLRQHTDQLQIEVAERERTGHALLGMIQRLEALRALDNKILEAHLPAEVAGVALRHLAHLATYWSASVMMFDHQRGAAVILARERGPDSRFEPGDSLPLDQYGQADLETLGRGEICSVSDLAAQAARPAFLEKLLRQGMRAYVRIPIMIEGTLAGALSMGSDRPGGFTAEQMDIASTIANQLGIALQQANLRQRISQQAAELERRVIERTAELEAANADLEAFSYSVSHDLRAPLRAIDGFSRMFEAEYAHQLDPEGQRFIEAIRSNGERMGTLIDDLLRFARFGRAQMHTAPVDMAALAGQAWAEVRSSGAECRFGTLPAALGDRALLKQVWINLLDNAQKYSSKRSDALIEVSAGTQDGQIVYCVADNGVGFDMRYYDKLFGVFQRLHSAREFPGSGVGLTLVQRVISRHGGRIWAESTVGQGARFYFSLPQPPAATAAAH